MRKKRFYGKRVLFLLLIVVLMTGLSVLPVSAARKKYISKKRVTLNTGSSATVKLIGTIRYAHWSVSGKKLITFRERGRKHKTAIITAGTIPGSCYLVAKSGKKTFRCKVTVQDPNAFHEKPVSSSTKNMTGAYRAKKVKSLEPGDSFIRAVADTSVSLMKEVAKEEKSGKNILISPDSILTAIAMVENGAAGETLSEMEKALGGISVKKYKKYLAGLHKPLTSSKQLTYQIANSVWYKNGQIRMKESYLQDTVNYFGADIFAAPFNGKTVKDINTWAYNHTQGKIPSIIERLEPDARSVLMNAVYFKGKWGVPYETTMKRKFTQADGSKKTVDMLESDENIYLTIGGGEGFVKPYVGGSIGFLGLLPPENVPAETFLQNLTGKDFIDGYNKRRTKGVLVRTRMPKFRYDYSVALTGPLKKLGVKRAFTDDADFSGMTEDSISIDEIQHKTFIEVNEEGTEAAAVTAVLLKANSLLPSKKEIKEVYLDRPFIYGLIDMKTGIPLFIGMLQTMQ